MNSDPRRTGSSVLTPGRWDGPFVPWALGAAKAGPTSLPSRSGQGPLPAVDRAPPLEYPRPHDAPSTLLLGPGPLGPRRAFPTTPRTEDEITAVCHQVPAS